MEPVAADAQGAIDVDDLRAGARRRPDGPTIVCLQAGNVNTGACDDLRAAICDSPRRHGAAGCTSTARSGCGPRRARDRGTWSTASSWPTRGRTDAHKWLNVPYDAALVFCAHPAAHAAAMSYTAAYLVRAGAATRRAGDFVPESSRRARGFAVWAALRELGRDGVADLVDRCCALARRFADGPGARRRRGASTTSCSTRCWSASATDAAHRRGRSTAVQRDGTCWMGGTTWRGRRLMRISVSNWSTTEADVDRSVAAILRIADTV